MPYRGGAAKPPSGRVAGLDRLAWRRRYTRPSLRPVRWQSGDAADCKSANVGSIPARTSSALGVRPPAPAPPRKIPRTRGHPGGNYLPRRRCASGGRCVFCDDRYSGRLRRRDCDHALRVAAVPRTEGEHCAPCRVRRRLWQSLKRGVDREATATRLLQISRREGFARGWGAARAAGARRCHVGAAAANKGHGGLVTAKNCRRRVAGRQHEVSARIRRS